MIEARQLTFAEQQALLREKVQWAPRGRRKTAAIEELRQLVRRELEAERQAREVVLSEPDPLPEPPADLFERAEDTPPQPADAYGGRTPYWVQN